MIRCRFCFSDLAISTNGAYVTVTPCASCQIRKIAGCACAGNAGNIFPRHRLQRKPLVSYPGMHHGTCVTHVPWCMSGSLTRGGGENVPVIPGACAPAILRIWQEAHGLTLIHGKRMSNAMWDAIIHPFPNFNGATVKIWEWISNFIPHFIIDLITDLFWDWS